MLLPARTTVPRTMVRAARATRTTTDAQPSPPLIPRTKSVDAAARTDAVGTARARGPARRAAVDRRACFVGPVFPRATAPATNTGRPQWPPTTTQRPGRGGGKGPCSAPRSALWPPPLPLTHRRHCHKRRRSLLWRRTIDKHTITARSQPQPQGKGATRSPHRRPEDTVSNEAELMMPLSCVAGSFHVWLDTCLRKDDTSVPDF